MQFPISGSFLGVCASIGTIKRLIMNAAKECSRLSDLLLDKSFCPYRFFYGAPSKVGLGNGPRFESRHSEAQEKAKGRSYSLEYALIRNAILDNMLRVLLLF